MAAVRAPGALADAKQLPQRPSEAGEEREGAWDRRVWPRDTPGLSAAGCRGGAKGIPVWEGPGQGQTQTGGKCGKEGVWGGKETSFHSVSSQKRERQRDKRDIETARESQR